MLIFFSDFLNKKLINCLPNLNQSDISIYPAERNYSFCIFQKLEIKVKQLEQQIIAKEILRREQMAEAEKLRQVSDRGRCADLQGGLFVVTFRENYLC